MQEVFIRVSVGGKFVKGNNTRGTQNKGFREVEQ
jgi:hypothetical protein